MGHDGAKRGHDSAKMGHDSGKMGILSSTWELLGQFWEHFLMILGDGRASEKHWFLHFWEARKRCLRHLGGCLGQFRNISGHVGDQMASKRDKMATKRANMATKSAKMSQHERE